MSTATVRVDRVDVREGIKNGRPWTRWDLYDANGDRYSSFKGSLGPLLLGERGKMLDIEFEVSEQGKNLQSIKPHAEERPLAVAVVDAARTLGSAKDRLIVREVALKAAVEFAVGRDLAREEVETLADGFVAWLLAENIPA